MKKVKVIIIALILCNVSFAQKIYISGGAAFSFQSPSANNGVSVTEANASTTSYESVKSKLASGVHPQITIGYFLNKYAAFEISTGYHFGSKQTIENQMFVSSISYTQSTEKSIQYGFINPCFVLNPGFEKWNPYLGLGAFIGYSNQMTEEITNSNSQYFRRYTSSGGSQFGFMGKIGLNYKLNSNWHIYSELSFSNAAWAPEKRHLNAAKNDAGTDVYESMKPHDLLTEYKEEYKHGNPGIPDMTKSQKKLKYSIPMDFVSLGIGISYSF
jgi:outer membrane protein W